jgi:soluble cytochrome b562
MSMPSKKKPKTIELILANLREGLTKEVACSQAGITRMTLHRWCEEDEELALDVQAAIDVSQAVLIKAVTSAAFTDWRAAAWMLERRWPGDFAAKRDVEVSVNNKSDGTDVVVGMIAQAQALLISGDVEDQATPPASNKQLLDETE